MQTNVAALLFFFLSVKVCAASIGFQQLSIPDPGGKPILVGIWYPTEARTAPQPLGIFSQSVALNGKISGRKLPVILVSHGAGGSLSSHYDTDLYLVNAGFVVVALTHTGDNDMDQSYVGNRKDLTDRPRQVEVVLDWVLSSWDDQSNLAKDKVGMLGFSLGAFTALVLAGGQPELQRMAGFCQTKPDAPECELIKSTHGDQLDPNIENALWVHDTRIKAAVVAAPASSFLFGPGDLDNVHIPIELWEAGSDDLSPNLWNSDILRKELPNLRGAHIISNADHFVFLAPCSPALSLKVPYICDDLNGVNRSAVHRDFNSSVAKFFSTELTQAQNITDVKESAQTLQATGINLPHPTTLVRRNNLRTHVLVRHGPRRRRRRDHVRI